jgi:adenosylcobinamide kinase/adenosylcobinamide-phosphate guanylyltransferase
LTLTLVLGGARSGKSRRAEAIARETGRERIYLATGEPFDDEMRARIETHKYDRAADGWTTIEEPLDLAGRLIETGSRDRVVLVECLTTWLGNLMHHERDITAATTALVDALATLPGDQVLVSNEVGLGIMPMNTMARRFLDEGGRLNQTLAARADRVELVVAGVPLVVK